MKQPLMTLALCVGALACLYQVHALAQRRVLPIVIDYAPPPKTLEGLVQRADLVAVVTLKSATYRNMRGPTSHFKAEITEVIKDAGGAPVGPAIDVYRHGGRIETAEGLMDQDELHFARWSPGMTLLVFLVWNSYVNEYTPAGPDFAFQLEPVSGKVKAFGRSSVARARHGRANPAVLAEVRDIKKKITGQ